MPNTTRKWKKSEKLLLLAPLAALALWQAASRLSPSERFGHRHETHSVQFSPDGKYLLSTGSDHRHLNDNTDNSVALWSRASRWPQRTRKLPEWTDKAAFSPDGYHIALVQGTRVEVWSRDLTRRVRALATPKIPISAIEGLAFSTSGVLALNVSFYNSTARHPSEVFLWDVRAAKLLRRVGNLDNISALAFSPRSGRLFVQAMRRGKKGPGFDLLEFDAPSGALKHVWPRNAASTEWSQSLAFSADGRLLAVDHTLENSYRGVAMLDVATRRLLWKSAPPTPSGEPVARSPHLSGHFAFSSRGHFAVAGDTGAIEQRHPRTGAVLSQWNSHGEARSLSFSPDGRALAWVSDQIHIRDVSRLP